MSGVQPNSAMSRLRRPRILAGPITLFAVEPDDLKVALTAIDAVADAARLADTFGHPLRARTVLEILAEVTGEQS